MAFQMQKGVSAPKEEKRKSQRAPIDAVQTNRSSFRVFVLVFVLEHDVNHS